jgi:hypothetical protein
VRSPNESWIADALSRYERPLLRHAAWLLNDRDHARDVVQEVFLRLCREKPDRVADHVAEWRFTVCRHLSLDVRERDQRRRRLDETQELRVSDIAAAYGAGPAGSAPRDSRPARTAYTSNESGQQEAYVRSFAPGTTFRISKDGAKTLRWRANGREMFYLAPGGRLMAVDVASSGNRFTVGAPRLLFRLPEPRAAEFEVTRDGDRFILFGNARQDEGRVTGRVMGLADEQGIPEVEINFVGPFAGHAERALASFPLMPEEIAERLGIAQVRTMSDAQGRFSVFAPMPGLYALIFRKDGYVGSAKPGEPPTSPLVTTTVIVREGETPPELSVTMTPKRFNFTVGRTF